MSPDWPPTRPRVPFGGEGVDGEKGKRGQEEAQGDVDDGLELADGEAASNQGGAKEKARDDDVEDGFSNHKGDCVSFRKLTQSWRYPNNFAK